MRINARLRDGSNYTLVVAGAGGDPATLFAELVAGRSQALRGWVLVDPVDGARQTVVLGDEIVELSLVDDTS